MNLRKKAIRVALLKGATDILPLSLAVLPWGVLFGSLAIQRGFSWFEAQLFSAIIFGYHNVTHGTQKYTYVKHTKLNRLERDHFELFGIRQQVLTKSIIMKMSASQSSFRKYLTSEQYMSFLTIFWQRTFYYW